MKIAFMVKCHQNLITSQQHLNTYSYWVTPVPDQLFSCYCADTQTHSWTDRTKTIPHFANLPAGSRNNSYTIIPKTLIEISNSDNISDVKYQPTNLSEITYKVKVSLQLHQSRYSV